MHEQVYTLNEFLKVYKLSKYSFYKLFERNEGPKIMQVGKRVYISKEAADEWRRQMEK